MSNLSSTRSDRDILQEVEKILLEDEEVSTDNIDIEVKDGKVNLIGSVISPEENHRIQDIVENVPGVSLVVNNMNVETMK